MDYKELQNKFEQEVRKPIKEVNNTFTVNIRSYPKIYIELLTPSVLFTNEEQNKVQQHAQQIDEAYRIINAFMDKLQK